MTLTLYEIADAYASLFAQIEAEGGELSNGLEEELDAAGGALDHKIEACCAKVREWELLATALGAEIDRLKARQQALKNSGKRLKAYVQDCLGHAGLDRVQTARFTATVQNSPPSARWVGDADSIPASYRVETTDVRFNAKAALDDLRAGVELPKGVEVVRAKHLVIR